MKKRFVVIPAARLLDELRDIGGKIAGSAVAEEAIGREIVFTITLPNRAAMRVYTTISAGADCARECGEDAIRLIVGARVGHDFRPLEKKSRKVLRTAPPGTDEARIVAFLARLRQTIREQYVFARSVPQCPYCDSAMRERTSKHGPFWGCVRFPECQGTRPRQVS